MTHANSSFIRLGRLNDYQSTKFYRVEILVCVRKSPHLEYGECLFDRVTIERMQQSPAVQELGLQLNVGAILRLDEASLAMLVRATQFGNHVET